MPKVISRWSRRHGRSRPRKRPKICPKIEKPQALTNIESRRFSPCLTNGYVAIMNFITSRFRQTGLAGKLMEILWKWRLEWEDHLWSPLAMFHAGYEWWFQQDVVLLFVLIVHGHCKQCIYLEFSPQIKNQPWTCCGNSRLGMQANLAELGACKIHQHIRKLWLNAIDMLDFLTHGNWTSSQHVPPLSFQ